MFTVEKIGGTSIADTETVLNNVLIGGRSGADPYNRVFVVSAYAGMTNMLLEHKKTGEPGVFGLFAGSENSWSWNDGLDRLMAAMKDKNAEIFDRAHDRERADEFVTERVEGVRSLMIDLHRLCSYGHFRLDEHLATVKELLAGLGEAHSAHNTALLLRQHGVNAVSVDLTGWRDDRRLTLDERIRDGLGRVDPAKELAIVTGYASCTEAMVRQFDRGYTEVTFSRLAVLTGADEAIIHKEFHLSSADPKLVGPDAVTKIGRTNYNVADQLSNLGMEAVHPRAAKGLRQAGIPLRVKNTFDPHDAGTVIDGDFISDKPRAEIVTGLPHVQALRLFEQDMVGVKGYDGAILEVLTRHGVRIVSKCTNANTITHYVDCTRKALNRVIADLEAKFDTAEVTTRGQAIVSVIGTNLGFDGLVGDAAVALHQAGVTLNALHRIDGAVDLQAIVDEGDFDAAVCALHRALVEDRATEAPAIAPAEPRPEPVLEAA